MFLIIILSQIVAQTNNVNHKQGSMYAFWGWNRGDFSNSDITFKGKNYNFTLKDVRAYDRQTKFGLDPYFNPTSITIPQVNYKIAYFIADNYSLSFGVDHMKYVMKNGQTVDINGTINTGSTYDGVYSHNDIVLAEDFLQFEHTDGLNYINLELEKFADLATFFNDNVYTSYLVGFGLGLLIPRSNTTLLNKERYDDFHISGWGSNLKVGLEASYFGFFTRSEYKFGYIDMPDVRTTKSASDHAEQSFTFHQLNILLGYYF